MQKFGNQSVEQIEHLRCKHRIRVLQGHEDTTKQNVVSRGHLLGAHGIELTVRLSLVIKHGKRRFLLSFSLTELKT
jgi:hypothetical protein